MGGRGWGREGQEAPVLPGERPRLEFMPAAALSEQGDCPGWDRLVVGTAGSCLHSSWEEGPLPSKAALFTVSPERFS